MLTLIVLFGRLFIIYLVIKMLLSFFAPKLNKVKNGQKKKQDKVKRYNAPGAKIEDADFEEIK